MADELQEMNVLVMHRVQMEAGKVGLRVTLPGYAGMEPPSGMVSLFQISKRDSFMPGSIYAAMGRLGDDGSICTLRLKAMTWKTQVQGEIAASWRVIDEQLDRELARESLMKKLTREPALAREVEKLAGVYARLPWNRKHSFFAALQDAVVDAAKGK